MIPTHRMKNSHNSAYLRRGRIFLVLAGIAWSTLMIMTSSAGAASYSVWACADGAGHRVPAPDWKPARVSSPLGVLQSSCGDPAAESTAHLTATAVSSPTSPTTSAGVGWTTVAPPGTSISGLELWWVAMIRGFAFSPARIEITGPTTVYNLQSAPIEDGTRFGGARFGGDFAQGAGSESIAYSETNHQTYRRLDTKNVTLMAWCMSLCQGLKDSGVDELAYIEAYRLKTAVDDRTPPAGFITGLSDGARLSAPTAIEATATDVGSGIREMSLRLDGRVIQRVATGGSCADIDPSNSDPYEYARMQPCPVQHSAVFMLSPAELAGGARHVVSVVATDAAGQESDLAAARAALVPPPGFFASSGFFNPDLDVVAPRTLNGVNAGPANLRLSFVVRHTRRQRFVARRVVGAASRPRISGRLTNARGVSISGARVWRAVAVAGAWRIVGKPLTTSVSGHVTGRLAARTPSRDVRLVYFPYSDSSENVRSFSRRLEVRASTTIHLDRLRYRNGDTVRFSGRITTAPVIDHKSVYLQVVVRGRWRTFDTTRADLNGRWKLRYRFTATRSATLYRFRAVVPTEQLFLWASGRSRAVRVLVTP